jgi:hypothetical protein
MSSVYHLPEHSATHYELSESSLNKRDREYLIIGEQFKPFSDTISTEKRFTLVKYLLLYYHSKLATNCVTKHSKTYFCNMCLEMCKLNRATLKIQPIYLTSSIYMQMLYTLYHIFNNNHQEFAAYIAIEAIYEKAEEELLSDVILVNNFC